MHSNQPVDRPRARPPVLGGLDPAILFAPHRRFTQESKKGFYRK
jgi:hypothetical protein